MAAKKSSTTAKPRKRRKKQNIYGTGDRGKATRLHSRIIRINGVCEICGSDKYIQAAHMISRKYDATRTDLRNAMALCAKCHLGQSHFSPMEISLAFIDKHGKKVYNELKKRALAKEPVDWAVELKRLQDIADELGLEYGNGTSSGSTS